MSLIARGPYVPWRSTGSALPLMWAHAEYIKLLRSLYDGRVFDLIHEVAQRYILDRKACKLLEIWKPNWQVCHVEKGHILRVQAPASFRLHWSRDGWESAEDTLSRSTGLGIEFVDIPVYSSQRAPIWFTFFWTAAGRWEGKDYEVAITERV